MRFCAIVLCFSLVLSSISINGFAAEKEAGVRFPMKYEGGSLGLDQHDALKTWVAKDEVVIVQGKKRFVIPVKNITEISYGNDVHRRVGAAVGVGVVSFGLGALMLLVKTKKHYVGVIWTDKTAANGETSKGGVVFKVGKGDYRGFMSALEGVSGLKAVSADTVGSGGTTKP